MVTVRGPCIALVVLETRAYGLATFSAGFVALELTCKLRWENQVFKIHGWGADRERLELDQGLAEALTVLACIRAVYDWDWPGADRDFQQAITIGPNYSAGPDGNLWFTEIEGSKVVRLTTPISSAAQEVACRGPRSLFAHRNA